MTARALCGVLALILAAPAVAVELPVATGRITFVETVPGSPGFERFKSDTEYNGETLTLEHVSEEGDAEGRGVVSLSNVPSVLAVATSYSASLYAQTFSQAVYYMSVQGSAGTVVPVRMRGLLEASDGATFRFSGHFAQAILGVRDNLTNESMGGRNLYADLGFSNPVQRHVFDQMLSLRAGSVYAVIMMASAGAQGMNEDYENAPITSRAFVDPYFNIDPGFLSANPEYALAFGTGVGNALPPIGAVPEPAAWVMMILGVGAVGAAARRRRWPVETAPASCPSATKRMKRSMLAMLLALVSGMATAQSFHLESLPPLQSESYAHVFGNDGSGVDAPNGGSYADDRRFSGAVVAQPLATGASITNAPEFPMALVSGSTSATVQLGIIRMGATLARGNDRYPIPDGEATPSIVANVGSRGSFVDGFTITGTTPRVRVQLSLRFDGFSNMGSGPDADAQARILHHISLESQPADSLLLLGTRLDRTGLGFWSSASRCDVLSNGNQQCNVLTDLQQGRHDQGAFAGRRQVEFEVDNGATIWVAHMLDAGLSQGGTFAEESGWPQVTLDLTRTSVFDGFSGEGLTGIHSAHLGDLRSVGGVFSYETVHVLSAVPEPGNALMLVLGLGVVAWARRPQRIFPWDGPTPV